MTKIPYYAYSKTVIVSRKFNYSTFESNYLQRIISVFIVITENKVQPIVIVDEVPLV